MEAIVILEDQQDIDTGGGTRESWGKITIDSSLPFWKQVDALLYEGMGLLYDNVLSHDQLTEDASFITGLLKQLDGKVSG